ncbi:MULTISPECIES: TetR family transcriptional regulator [unclassified Streptomyces]|nr:TetR family transcriptional regulator [Streptomyces sp. SID4923]
MVLDAASAAFACQGYRTTSLRSIVSALGLTHAILLLSAYK